MVTAEQIRGAAQGMVQSLAKMTPKEREGLPTVVLIENYNNLLSLAKEAAPRVDARIWPKAIGTFDSTMGPSGDTRYAELEAYARQIFALTV